MDTTTASSERLSAFARLVVESPHNLVSERAKGELMTRHIPECVALAEMLPAGPQRVLDLGSGGGFPGVVLAIMRADLEVHLLDSTQKKTGFLESAAEELGLAVTVHLGRAERLATDPLAGSFDVVTARAVAPLRRLVQWAVPFLRVGGVLYAVKGARWAEELDAATSLLRRIGAQVMATPDDLPVQDMDGSRPRVVIIARDR